MSEWFITDDDCLQCCKPLPVIEANQFEFMQINSYEGRVDHYTPFFQVSHGTIDMSEYTEEELQDFLNAYGYEDLDDFVIQNSPDDDFLYRKDGTVDRTLSPSYLINYQLLAEMVFETENQEYVIKEFPSWNDAVTHIAKTTGMDLTAYLKQKSLDEQIQTAAEKVGATPQQDISECMER